jgi:IgA Peptidase M64
MLDSKLFVSRLNDPFPDLYERFWNGVEWIWINHGRPDGVKMKNAPGAAMMNEKLFVVTDDGSLWERHWRGDLSRWVWEGHGRPENRPIEYGPSAAMMNEKFFVVTNDGNLWERHWRGDLGRWAWEDHGRPGNQKIIAAPGAAMMNQKLFVATEDGNLWERHWRGDLGRWAWEDHGRPGNQKIIAAPGAVMMNQKLFVATEDGNLWERHWRGDLSQWAWEDHGRPPDTQVATAPEGAMMDSKLFVGTRNGHLFERVWTDTEWTWVDHGTPFHDQSAHVIGAPGSEPKLTIAVMGDGFTESDLNDYRNLVQDKVVRAFRLNQLGESIGALRVIRIDVVSPVSDVTERTYDEHGTTDPSDDTLTSETFRYSRLGFISTGLWSHCWIETSARTNERITSIRRQFAPDATNVIVLVNSSKSGGCNRGDIAVFTKQESAEVIAHELGHNLFDLGDEYTNDTQNFSGTARNANLTETLALWNNLKWSDLVAADAPLPTDANSLPRGWNRNTSVGAFEGGGAHFSTGIFRPVLECRMNQNNPRWCPVCGREIARILGVFL